MDKLITDKICMGRLLGWRVARCQVQQGLGERATIILGWRGADMPLERSETIQTPRGVEALEWSALPDDRIEVRMPWSDALMAEICTLIGATEFERGASSDRLIWWAVFQ